MTYDLVDRRSRKRASQVYVYRRRPIVCTCVAVSTGCKDMFHAITSQSTYSEGFYSTIRTNIKQKNKKQNLHLLVFVMVHSKVVQSFTACVHACARTQSQTHIHRNTQACTYKSQREIAACSFRVATFQQIQFASAYTLITWILLLPFFVARVDSVQTFCAVAAAAFFISLHTLLTWFALCCIGYNVNCISTECSGFSMIASCCCCAAVAAFGFPCDSAFI